MAARGAGQSATAAIDRWTGTIPGVRKPAPSMRAFGVVMFAACSLVSLLLFIRSRGQRTDVNRAMITMLLGIAAVILLTSIVLPARLRGFHAAWMAFAERLGALMSGIALVVAYVVVVIPVGLLMRLAGRDPLDRRVRGSNVDAWHVRGEAAQGDRFDRLF